MRKNTLALMIVLLTIVCVHSSFADTLVGTHYVSYKFNCGGLSYNHPTHPNPYYTGSIIEPGAIHLSAEPGTYKVVVIGVTGDDELRDAVIWSGDSSSGTQYRSGLVIGSGVEFVHDFGEITLYHNDWYAGDNDDIGVTVELWLLEEVIPNNPPVAICQDVTLVLDENGEATLAASQVDGGSSDPDGDTITLSIDRTAFTCADIGENTVTLTVTDDEGASASCLATVTVVDVAPPAVELNLLTDTLWPVNHKLVKVADISATDTCDAGPELVVVVTSNEPINGPGDGNTEPDWVWDADTGELYLRAERSGGGDGRVYTISVTATDDSGNIATASAEVIVPHDKGGKKK